jgi:MarR family transcriptional regulator, organic hydroperoxide resistance regulator
MFDFLIRSAPDRTNVLGRLGLTPNDSRGLSGLDLVDGRTMRELADEWRCDASNATWIVDRLERLGLAERRTPEADRRKKLVVLTKHGAAVRAKVLEAFRAPPVELLELDRRDLASLHSLLAKLEAPAPLRAARKRRAKG